MGWRGGDWALEVDTGAYDALMVTTNLPMVTTDSYDATSRVTNIFDRILCRKLKGKMAELVHQKQPRLATTVKLIQKTETRISELLQEKRDIEKRITESQDALDNDNVNVNTNVNTNVNREHLDGSDDSEGNALAAVRKRTKKSRVVRDESDADYDSPANQSSASNDEDDDDDQNNLDDGTGISFKTAVSELNDPDRYIDDGDESFYQARLESWCRSRRAKRIDFLHLADINKPLFSHANEAHADDDQDNDDNNDDWEFEPFQPCVFLNDHELEGGLTIPGDIYTHLFDYQKTCVSWLWELYSQKVGGVLGDEMGLGKTVQIISFLASLGMSKKLKGPILIVCPATVLRQWVQEFHKWW